jgi:alanyl-tRNA synthetase
MPTELLYYTDPFTLDFTARITGKTILPDGRIGIALAQTYFYPTGGGQEHDTGTLGDARVIEVTIDDAGDVLHIVDRDVIGEIVPARIDGERRRAFMQHHSAQHLLSHTFEHARDLETLSAKISIESPATIDLPAAQISESDLTRVENLANEIIREDRAIKSYFVAENEIGKIPLRRPPKVSGQIRIVEIDALDYSACGGTHCTQTGMIGVLKILRVEPRGDRTRIHFVAGQRALDYFQEEHAIVARLALDFSVAPKDILATVERQREALRAALAQIEELGAYKLRADAAQLIANAERIGTTRFVCEFLREQTIQQARALALILKNEANLVSVLATRDDAKIGLLVTCGEMTGVNANALLRKLLTDIGGRGGGDARLAQGGGAASDEQLRALLANARSRVA